MAKPDIFIGTAFLATKDKLVDRVLYCNRIEANDISGDFLFYLIEVTLPNQNPLVKKIIQIIQNDAKTTIGLSPDNFEKTLSLLNENLKRLSETSNNAWIGNINAIVGLVQGRDIYLSQTGNIVGYIFRHNKISSLTDQSDDSPAHPGRTFTEIVSGNIAAGDQLIFSNSDLFNYISIDRLRNLVKTENVRAEVLELKQYLQKTHAVNANAVFIEVKDEKTENDLEEMVFLDETEETAFKAFVKELTPKLKKVWQQLQKYTRDLTDKSKKILGNTKESWNKEYGPKTKKLFKTGNEKLKNTLKSGGEKITELSSSTDGPFSHKIKTNQYQKKPVKNANQNFDKIWQKIEEIDFSSRLSRQVIIGILIFLTLTIGYVKVKNNNVKNSEAAKQIETSAAYNKAEAAFTQAQKDLQAGKSSSLDEFYSALSLAKTAKENKDFASKADNLISQINTIIDTKTKTVRINSSSKFTLAGNLKSVVLVGNEIYGANTDGKIYSADVRDKAASLIGSVGADNGNVIRMVYSSATNSIFISTDSKKLLSLDLTSKVIGKLTNADPNSDWKTLSAFTVYTTNTYAIDTITTNVAKYTHASASSYSKASTYIDGKKFNLTGAVDLAIDGDIFVLKSDGSVMKFTKGVQDTSFVIKDIPAPKSKIEQPEQIYTGDDTTNIYVLDKTNNRVIKFDKSGEFTGQYVFDNVTIDSFVVNPKLQKIWAISAGKVYEGNL